MAKPSSTGAEAPSRRNVLEPSEEQKDIQHFEEEARKAQEAGDFARAIDRLGSILEIDPSHRVAALERSRLCRAAGRQEEALRTVEAALSKSPGDVALLEEKAAAELEKGDARKALETVRQITSAGAVAPGARYLQAVIHASLSEREEALRALEDAVEHNFLDLKRLESEKRLASLQSEQRFLAVVAKIRSIRDGALAEGERMRLRELKSQAFPQAGRVDSEEALMELQSRLELGSNDETTFDVVGIDGKRLRLADCRGKALIVVCAVKTSELGQMQVHDATQLRDQYASKGLEVFSFFREPEPDPSAPDEALESVKNYMSSFDVRLPAALLDDRTAQSMRLTAYPSTLFFGADGKCYFKANGYFGYPNFRLMAEALLKGPAPLPKRG